MTFNQTEGSKAQVWHGTAKRTSGHLTKSALMKNKHGRIVSIKQHKRGKQAIKELFKMGFKPKKGTFKAFHKHRKGSKKMRGGVGNAVGVGNVGAPLDRALVAGGGRGSRKMRGGMYALSPSPISGITNTSGVDLQFVAGNAN